MAAATRALFLCFAVASAGPSPSDIEKLVCELATSKQVEEKAIGAICTTIAAKFPSVHFNPDCVTAVGGVWDIVATKFPKDCKGLPTPADAGKLMCQLATQKMIEERAIDTVCGLIKKSFPNVDFNPDCKSVLEGAWDLIAFECPKGREEAAMTSLPTPADIEKLVCELASQKLIEDRATDTVCSLINRTFPDVKFNPDCKTLSEGVWDIVESKCPKGNEGPETFPSPGDIEKLICGVVNQTVVQERVTRLMCSTVHIPDCERVVGTAFKALADECQSPASLPDKLEKLVCDLAKRKDMEDKAATAVCQVVHSQFPAVPAWACTMALKSKWEALEAHCPKEQQELVLV